MQRSLLVVGMLGALCHTASAGEPPQAVKILEDLNAWCDASQAAKLDCAIAEGRDPKETPKPAVVARIATDRAALRKLGVEIEFTNSIHFETPTEMDVRLIIGGHFGADHIGPDWHDEVVKRVNAEPAHYVAVLERVVGKAPNPSFLSSTFVVDAVARFSHAGATAEAKALAKKLVPLFEAAQKTAAPKGDAGFPTRIQQRLDGVRLLAK